jgi:Glycosyl transferase family 11
LEQDTDRRTRKFGREPSLDSAFSLWDKPAGRAGKFSVSKRQCGNAGVASGGFGSRPDIRIIEANVSPENFPNHMIFVQLKAGLGNQMFQYAAGLRLARKHNTELKLDISAFQRDPFRAYGLDAFNISGRIANPGELPVIPPPRRSLKRFFLKRTRVEKDSRYLFLTEKHFHFDPEILTAPDNTYLDGYWQSEKYFRDIDGDIRKEFSLKEHLDGKNGRLFEEIGSSVSVSVHIRRGDYVTNQRLIHGACSLDYYLKCAEIIHAHEEKARFFVFTDDPKWVAENLRLPSSMKIVEGNQDAQGYKDLWLMSACQHNIIANSSFGWWGAWLNANPQKIVLAPKRWFGRGTLDTADLVPDSWRRI